MVMMVELKQRGQLPESTKINETDTYADVDDEDDYDDVEFDNI